MALTLDVEQRLTKVSLVKFYDDHKRDWQEAVQKTYDYIKDSLPNGTVIRVDDVSIVLLPIMRRDETLGATLSTKRLTQKYWVGNFVDLMVDKTWNSIRKA